MNPNSSITFYNGYITPKDVLVRIARNYKNSIIDKTGSYFYYKDGKWHKTIIEKGFTFIDVITGKHYVIKIDKKCNSTTTVTSVSSSSTTESVPDSSSSTTDNCNNNVLFTVSVYDGSPSGTGTLISGPVDMIQGDALNFWSTGGILNTVTQGSVDVQNEVTNQIVLPPRSQSCG